MTRVCRARTSSSTVCLDKAMACCGVPETATSQSTFFFLRSIFQPKTLLPQHLAIPDQSETDTQGKGSRSRDKQESQTPSSARCVCFYYAMGNGRETFSLATRMLRAFTAAREKYRVHHVRGSCSTLDQNCCGRSRGRQSLARSQRSYLASRQMEPSSRPVMESHVRGPRLSCCAQ